jgi:hypothetical protein
MPPVASCQRLSLISISYIILIANEQDFSFLQRTAVLKAKHLKEK